METILTTIGVGVFMALVSPFVAAYSAKRIDYWKKEDAYKRLMKDPHIQVGAICRAIYLSGRDQALVPRCQIGVCSGYV